MQTTVGVVLLWARFED